MTTGSTTVTLPDGCYGIKMTSDGREFNARPGGTISVPDEYMGELRTSSAVQNGVLSASRSFRLGTKRGMVCRAGCCLTIWQAWTKECPRCHQPTRPE